MSITHNRVEHTRWVKETASFTWTNFGTVSSHEVWWQRRGTDIHIRGSMIIGTPVGADVTLVVPSKWAVDTAVMTATTDIAVVGTCFRCSEALGFAAAQVPMAIFWDDGSDVTFYMAMGAEADVMQRDHGTALAAVTDSVTFIANWPVSGW